MSCDTKINFVMIGSKSTGKTRYVTSLADKSTQITATKNAIEYTDPIIREIKQNKPLSPTSSGVETLCFRYKDDEYDTNFLIDDYDGKFAATLYAEGDNENKDKLIKNIKLSEGIMFLFPHENQKEYEDLEEYKVQEKKDLIRSKYEDIRRELGFILQELSEKHPDGKIPIPVVIAVTMWDLSPFYPIKADETENTMKYINGDDILKDCYDIIENNFDYVKITPISSKKAYLTEVPIRFFLDKTYYNWEKTIQELEKSNNQIKLITYLYKWQNELGGYKDGEYTKLYCSKEQEYFKSITEKLQNIDKKNDIEEFKKDNYFLSKDHKKIIDKKVEELDKKEEKLASKDLKNKIFKVASILFILLVVVAIYRVLSVKSNEEKLFTTIEKGYQEKDYAPLQKNIDRYLEKYNNTSKDNYNRIVEIKSKYNVECKTYLNKGLQDLVGYQELQKRIDTLKEMVSTNKSCGQNSLGTVIDDKLKDDTVLQEQYYAAMQLLNAADVSMINWKQVSSMLHLIDTLPQRDSKKLKDKLQGLIATIVASDNEEAIEMILSHEGILNLPEEMNAKLQKRRGSLEIEYSFRELVSEINNHDFVKAASMVETQYRKDFDDEQKKGLSNILQKKFNIETGKILKNQMPGNIRHIDDFYRMEKAFGDIRIMKTNGVVKVIEFTPIMNGENKDAYEQKRKILMGYMVLFSQGFTPSHISFSAYSENNEPLGFMCNSLDSNDDIILKINNRIYDYDGANCRGTQITYSNRFRYSPGQYFGEVTEVDIISNDPFPFNIKLDKNDLIKLKNGNRVKKSIGNGYSITWIP